MNKIIKTIIMLFVSIILACYINYYFTSEVIKRLIFMPQSLLLPFAIIVLVIQIIFVFSIINLFVSKNIDIVTYRIFMICYFTILLFVLFVRPVVFRKLNLNVLDIINSLKSSEGALICIVNILLFIPIGYLFRHKNFIEMLVVMIPIEFVIELIQYIFKLGIFDINDIILNIVGISIGYLLFKNKEFVNKNKKI